MLLHTLPDTEAPLIAPFLRQKAVFSGWFLTPPRLSTRCETPRIINKLTFYVDLYMCVNMIVSCMSTQ